MQKSFKSMVVIGGIFLTNLVFGGSPRTHPRSFIVSTTNNLTFEPDSIEVMPGDTIVWVNGSFLVHTVTCDTALATIKGSALLPEGALPFNSGNLNPGERFSIVLTIPGKYRYFCIPHEGAKMRGTIIVKDQK